MDLKTQQVEQLVCESLEQIRFLSKLELSTSAKALGLSSINIKLAEDIKVVYNSRHESNLSHSGDIVKETSAKKVEELMEQFIKSNEHWTVDQLNSLNELWTYICQASAESNYPIRIKGSI